MKSQLTKVSDFCQNYLCDFHFCMPAWQTVLSWWVDSVWRPLLPDGWERCDLGSRWKGLQWQRRPSGLHPFSRWEQVHRQPVFRQQLCMDRRNRCCCWGRLYNISTYFINSRVPQLRAVVKSRFRSWLSKNYLLNINQKQTFNHQRGCDILLPKKHICVLGNKLYLLLKHVST